RVTFARLTALINAASSCSAHHAEHKPPNMSETTVKRATFIIGISITHYASTDFHLSLAVKCVGPHVRHNVKQFLFPDLALAILSKAARNPLASLTASSFAQKCMKNRRGCSSSIWLWSAVIWIPLDRRALMTGLTSSPVSTKSPVIAALPPPVS